MEVEKKKKKKKKEDKPTAKAQPPRPKNTWKPPSIDSGFNKQLVNSDTWLEAVIWDDMVPPVGSRGDNGHLRSCNTTFSRQQEV